MQDPFAEQLASRREDDEAQLAMDTEKQKGLQPESFCSSCLSQAEVAASVLCRQLAFAADPASLHAFHMLNLACSC